MDYYSILGVNKDASQDDIKRAYRNLAKQHHPDRTGGDDTAFKKINEAYDTLKDPAKRSEYDNPNLNNNFTSQNYNTEPFSSFDNLDPFYRDMFRNFQRQTQTRAKNRDITIAVTITLSEVVTGKALMAQYKLYNGKKEIANVNIPPGVSSGDKIRFGQLGDNSLRGIPRGDLIVIVKIKPDPRWRRDGDNLHKTIKIDYFDILLGTSVDFYTIDNKLLKLNIKKGTRPGTILSLNGYGLPNLNTSRRGNIMVKIDAEVPVINSEDILDKIRSIKDEVNSISK